MLPQSGVGQAAFLDYYMVKRISPPQVCEVFKTVSIGEKRPNAKTFGLLIFLVFSKRVKIISSRIEARDELSSSRTSFFPLHEGHA